MKTSRMLPALLISLLMAMTALQSGCSSANGESPPWTWLGENGGTYWYVPSANLEAIQWDTGTPSDYSSLDDQTVWHIERYENGYFFGPAATKFAGYPMSCQYLIGSVTPEGRVYITFNSIQTVPIGNPSLTTGLGNMVQKMGDWTFSMQMASGSSSKQISHWAYMLQCAPDQPCWDHLPGVNQSIPEFLAQCQ